VLRDNGEIKLSDTAGSGQAFNSSVRLGPDSSNASYSLRNDASGKTLTVSAVSGMSGGTKSLNVNGVGPVTVQGILDKGSSTLDLYFNTSGTLTLNGNTSARQLFLNGTNAVVNLGTGSTFNLSNGGGSGFMASQSCTINGPGVITLSTTGGNNHIDNGVASNKTVTVNAKITGATGFEFWQNSPYINGIVNLNNSANDYTLSSVINVPGTIQFSALANRGVACGLGKGTNLVLNAVGARFLYTGTGDTSDRLIDVQAGGIIEQAGTGNLKFTSATQSTTGNGKTLVLQGSTAGTGEFGGAIVNGSGVVSLTKDGTGTWTLSASNTYSGATLVNKGTLALAGAAGAILPSASVLVTGGGTLLLNNTAAANSTNRLASATPITLDSGTLNFASDAGAANFAEDVGAVTVNAGANTITATQAGAGQTSTLRLAALNRGGSGTLNFSGTGLGESDRNRIFVAGLGDGPLGTWATINGTTLAAYSNTLGIYAYGATAPAGIAARGPDSVIPNDAFADVHIDSDGTSGSITLAGAVTNRVFSLSQDTNVAAVVQTRDGLASKTFLSTAIQISAGQADLTIGESVGDGAVAPLGGVLSLGNENAAATLTVNAPVINNGAASGIVKSGPGTVRLMGLNTYSGQTAIVSGPLVFANSGTTQSLAGAVSGSGSLVKEGTGRLGLAGANSYTGLTTVSAGTLIVQNNAALGAATAGTVIADGATLDVAGLTNGFAINLNAEQIYVKGAGVNGRGAIINSFNSAQYNALRLVSLTGDTTFGGDLAGARWDIRNASGTSTFLMNNYNLTKVGSNYVGLTGVYVTPGATAGIDVKEGWFTLEAGTTLGGSAANTMTLRSGTIFDFYDLYTNVAWSLVMEDNSRVYARNGNATNRNTWAGPVTLNGRAVFDAAGTFSDVISGRISGPGSVVKTTANSTTYFLNTNNLYAGTTTISNGTLYAKTAGSLPGYNDGRLTVVAGGTLATHTPDAAGSFGWTAENVRDLNANSSFLGMTAWLSLDTTFSPMNIPYNLSRQMGLIKQGTNTLVLSGTNSTRGDTRQYAGDLILSGGGNNLLGMILVQNGNLYMTNTVTTYIDTTNQSVYLSDNAGNISRTRLGGKTAMSSILPGKGSTALPYLVVGQRGTASLYLTDDASVTNRLYIGNYSTAAGAVYQTGNNTVMHNWGGGSTDGRIGMTGYGYYELNSGTFTNNGWFQIGRDLTGVGILRQTGGAFKMGAIYDGNLGLSRGGTGQVYTAGGTFAAAATVNVGDPNDNGVIRGFADFTVAGSADVYVAGNMNMADRTNMFACVNLNGGRLTANQFSKGLRGGSTALVNFDGGTFVSRAGGSLFATGVNAPDAVNVYRGGAVIDTTNQLCAIPSGLLAPAGSGVSSISITPRGGYIGPPFVTITGGGGTGATAIAQFDSASGFVNGITVTCPGYGYTAAPTVSLSGGGTNVHNAAVASLASNVSGGLTKLGSGTLALTGTNTYAGATIISNGVLMLGVRQALPAGGAISVAGGSLDLGGFAVTNGAVSATGGAIVNGSLSCGSFTKTSNGTLTLAAPLRTATPLVLGGGVVKLQGAQPGLAEAPVAGAFNVTDNMTTSIVTRLTTRMANTVYYEPYNTTWIYKGYIWNRASTNANWTFAENFDDNVKLIIDATVVIATGNNWNTPTTGTINLSPGAHSFEARFGQGTGGGGPVNGNGTTPKSWWTTTAIGFGVDFLGRNDTNILNYVAVADPGDGSLLTLTASGSSPTNLVDSSASVELAASTVLDLDVFVQTFANVSGSGIISNGTLAATGAIMPGGDGTLGTLTVANSSGISGKLRIDVGAAGASDKLAVAGNLDLSKLSLEIANPAQLDTTQTYTVATATGALTGSFSAVAVPNSRWHVVSRSNGDVQLIYAAGSLIKIR
jgi:autotransporter-associated beta strand protein